MNSILRLNLNITHVCPKCLVNLLQSLRDDNWYCPKCTYWEKD